MSVGLAQFRFLGKAAPAAVGYNGWNVLPLGCGGLVIGVHISNDGHMVCRTDVGNIYRWSGTTSEYADPTKRWVPLMTYNSLYGQGPSGGVPQVSGVLGGWEHVLAPNSSNVHLAIFEAMQGVPNEYAVWYSTNSAATWSKTNITMANADSNSGYHKHCQYKIAIDPANANVAYCGMPQGSGNSAGAYTTLNQAGGSTLATWSSVKTSGATPIPACTNALSCGIVIDPSKSTTTVGGQTVTKHIIIPVGGVGIYESCDGGVTFVECAATAMGTGNFSVNTAGCNADGVYYCIVVHSTAGGVWRYINATTTPGGGTWVNLNNVATGIWGPASYTVGTSFLFIDPRTDATSKAYLGISGMNGIGIGFTATNANTATNATINWKGRTDSMYAYLFAEPYDIGYANDLLGQQKISGFTGGAAVAIDPTNGMCFWGGNQSFFYFGGLGLTPSPRLSGPNYASPTVGGPSFFDSATTSGLSTTIVLSSHGGAVFTVSGATIDGRGDPIDATMPGTGIIPPGTTIVSQSSGTAGANGTYVLSQAVNVSGIKVVVNGTNTFSWSMGRGMEATVAQDALCPPGGTYAILAAQDLGCPMRGTFISYPLTQAVKFHRFTNSHLDFAASDPSFVATRVTDQGSEFIDESCYSANYGADGSWVKIKGSPNSLYQASITAGLSNGSGAAGDILNVTAKTGGQIFPYSQICTTANGAGGQLSPGIDLYVQPYGTSGTSGTGGTGTYIVKQANGASGGLFRASGPLFSVTPMQSGQLVTVDPDHMVVLPIGNYTPSIGQYVVPAYTANARANPATWQLSTGLPAVGWMPRPWAYGPTCTPLAVGYGPDLGTVWACHFDGLGTIGGPPGTASLYRSTNSGASFNSTPIVTWPIGPRLCSYCLSMPTKPNELWVSGYFTSVGAPTYDNAGIWHITNANTSSATATIINLPLAPTRVTAVLMFSLGAPATVGGYPTLFMLGWDPGNSPIQYLFRGSYPGTGAVVTWTLFGPTGLSSDLPDTLGLKALQSIRGDWNTYQRLYVAGIGTGFGYYNP